MYNLYLNYVPWILQYFVSFKGGCVVNKLAQIYLKILDMISFLDEKYSIYSNFNI